jgi:hypothetical protein
VWSINVNFDLVFKFISSGSFSIMIFSSDNPQVFVSLYLYNMKPMDMKTGAITTNQLRVSKIPSTMGLDRNYS